jgi:hypothetical protein
LISRREVLKGCLIMERNAFEFKHITTIVAEESMKRKYEAPMMLSLYPTLSRSTLGLTYYSARYNNFIFLHYIAILRLQTNPIIYLPC